MYKSTTNKLIYFLTVLISCLSLASAKAQDATDNPCDTTTRYLYWTGEENNDFFNEKNWRITIEMPPGQAAAAGNPGKPNCLPGDNAFLYAICANTPDLEKDRYPKSGTLDPGVPIRFNLLIDKGSATANGDIVFACAQKGLTMVHAQLDVRGGSISQGVLSLLDESTVHLREGSFSPQLTLNFLDPASWVYFHQANPDALMASLNKILVNNLTGVLDNNFRINQYYQTGAVIRPLAKTFAPLQIFTGASMQGAVAGVGEDTIYKGSAIPGGMDNAIHSFLLKRGFMVTLANNANGTGKSRVYIASEADLVVNELDIALQGNISFIRVVPWNWVTKKGTGFYYNQVDPGWFYNWAYTNTPKPNTEYVPMAWGAGSALPPALAQIISKKKSTHVLGFNESDNCNDQSGQYNNLCQPSVAVAYYENLMSLGVRLGTPAPRENGPTTWLLEFSKIAKARDVRFDFVAVHWYDWGSNPASSPNADPQQIFNRFKAYLENVHKIYQLPIWITEFNANPNRGNAIQEGFLRLALPYLESLDYVERYAYFQPNVANAQNPGSSANYLDASGALTNIGQLYKDQVSTPSMPAATYACANNLDGLDQPFVQKPLHSQVFEAECGSYPGNQWKVLHSADASNKAYIQGDNTLAGTTALARQVHYEFDLQESDSYRVYIRAASGGGPGAIRIQMDGNQIEQISPFASSSFYWFEVPRFYDLGVGRHRLTIEYPNSNILLDQLAIVNGPDDLDLYRKDSGYCSPAKLQWGLEASDTMIFREAETAMAGSNWQPATSSNARGGAYLASEAGVSSADIPTGAEKTISFSIQADQTDEYELWAKIQAIDAAASGLWIAVDDEPFRKWSNLNNAGYAWYWKKFYYSYDTEDRSFTYFLAAGTHQVRIAIGSGAVAVDRIALVTKGKLPETADPNVLQLSEKLEFEAEEATLLGAAAIVDCASSSNGKQVNLFNVNTNGVRFDQIVAEDAGAYTLHVSYISAALRTFRVVVNGVALSRQNPPVSGDWCYNGGSPAVYDLVVQLNRGVNTIDITPFSGDAPFIDKIKLEKAPINGLSLEAELAQPLGTITVVNCATASNGALVNMGSNVANGIRFNNLLSDNAANYNVDIYYISKVNRNMRISVNGQLATTQAFTASGNWCYEGGTTRIQTIPVALLQGSNTIAFQPTGSDAPFIDKIVLRAADNAVTTARMNSAVPEMENSSMISVYPNPVREGTPVTVLVPATLSARGPVQLRLSDLSGRVLTVRSLPQGFNGRAQIGGALRRGMYILTINNSNTQVSRKIIVQ